MCGNVKINKSGQAPVAGFCEDDNEISYSIKQCNFLITQNKAARALLNQKQTVLNKYYKNIIFHQASKAGVQGLNYFATSGPNQLPGFQQPLLVYPGSVLRAGPILIPTQVSISQSS